MKCLVIYYSRSGTTSKIAKQIGLKLNVGLEEIKDHKNRKGFFGFIMSGNEAYFKKIIPIEVSERDFKSYDLLIIGTPVWANHVCTPVRSFLQEYREYFKEVAFFATSMGSNPQEVFTEMQQIISHHPIAVMGITTRDIKNQSDAGLVDRFIQNIEYQHKVDEAENDK